jgi:hypothetical protein
VLKILAEHSVAKAYQPMTDDEIDQAVRLYVDDGLSIRAIADKLGKRRGWHVQRAPQHGIGMRPPSRCAPKGLINKVDSFVGLRTI